MSVCVPLMIAQNSEALGDRVTALWTRIDKVYHIATTGTRLDLCDDSPAPVILLHDTSLIFYATKYLTEEKRKVA